MPQMGMTTIGQYLNEIGQYKLLTSEEMKELFIKYHDGDESAKELLINSNLRLVVQIAKRFYYSNVQLADLIQEGNIGLIKAIERFDVQRDFKFSTYAVPMIKQTMQRYIEEKKGIIRLPSHQHETYRKYLKYLDEYYEQFQMYPTKEEVIAKLGITEATYEVLGGYYKFNSPLSLDFNINDDNETTLNDIVASESDEFEEHLIEANDLVFLYKLKQLLGNLEYYIIYNRYIAETKKTQSELAEEFNITGTRIGQLEAKALNKIALNLNKNKELKLRDEYDLYKKISRFNPVPFTPDDAIAYNIFQSILDKKDCSIIFNNRISCFPLSIEELFEKIGDKDSNQNEFNEYVRFVLFMYDSFKKSKEFQEYKKGLIAKYKYRHIMESIDSESKISLEDYSELNIPINTRYEDFIQAYEDESKMLSPKDKKILALYFFTPSYEELTSEKLSNAEDEINLVLNNYFNGDTHIDRERLKNFYLKNRSKFTLDEQVSVDYYLYGLISLETYNSLKNPLSKEFLKSKEFLFDMLEKAYFGIRKLNKSNISKYDLKYARTIIDNDDLPLYGNKKLLLKIYNMYFGEQDNDKTYTVEEIKKLLGNIYSNEEIENAISSVMLAVLKYKNGIKKEKTVITKEELIEFGKKHWQSLSQKELEYLEELERSDDLMPISTVTIPKSLKVKFARVNEERKKIELANTTKKEAINIIRSRRLTKETRNTLMNYYSISGNDVLNGKEKKRVLKIIYALNIKKLNSSIKLKKTTQ